MRIDPDDILENEMIHSCMFDGCSERNISPVYIPFLDIDYTQSFIVIPYCNKHKTIIIDFLHNKNNHYYFRHFKWWDIFDEINMDVYNYLEENGINEN